MNKITTTITIVKATLYVVPPVTSTTLGAANTLALSLIKTTGLESASSL